MRCLITIAAVAVFAAAQVKATPITYTLTTTASGTLGSTAFTNATITMTFSGDTSTIVDGSTLGGPAYSGTLGDIGTATIIIGGVGVARLTDPAFILATDTNTTVFGESGVVIGDRGNNTGVLSVQGPSWFGYGLQALGSVTGPGGLGNGGGDGNTFSTSAGVLSFPRQEPPATVGSTFTAVTTQSLDGYQGGTTSSPAFLVTGLNLADLTGIIPGAGYQDYFWIYWNGGPFAAHAVISDMPNVAEYLFSMGAPGGNCDSFASTTLDSTNGYNGFIGGAPQAGLYCIGITAESGGDPAYSITFDTPVNTSVPEPRAFSLLLGSLALIAAAKRAL